MNNGQSMTSRYPELTMAPRILLGPGPGMVHPRVLQSMASPLVGHLDLYFITCLKNVTLKLLAVAANLRKSLANWIDGVLFQN
jgi:aspartate aminotransferase-like enzyme